MILSWLCVNIIVSVMIPPGYQCAEISCVSIAGIVNKSSDHGSSVNDAELLRSRIITLEKKLVAEKVDREKERARYELQLATKEFIYQRETSDLRKQINGLVSPQNILNLELNLSSFIDDEPMSDTEPLWT